MPYTAIAQVQDNKKKIVSELYLDFEVAKTAYLDMMRFWYQDSLKIVNGKMATPPNNPPFLISFDNMTTLHIESSDELAKIKQACSEYHVENERNCNEQHNKAVEIRKSRDDKINSIISSALTNY